MYSSARDRRQWQSTLARQEVTDTEVCHHQVPGRPVEPCLHRRFCAEATRDGGGRVYIRYNDGKAHTIIATGKYSTTFKVEAAQLSKKPQLRSETTFPEPSPMWPSSKMLFVLNKLQNSHQKDLNEVNTALVDLAAQTNLTLQWIPAHCRIKGNEQAEGLLVKEASLTKRKDTPLRNIIKTLSKKKKKKKIEAATPKHLPVRQPL